MENTYNTAQTLLTQQDNNLSAFELMNKQYIHNVAFNSIKPYLTSVAQQQAYAHASTRAQLVLGIIYAQQSFTTSSPMTKQFYAVKAQEYLNFVALQDEYKQGQKCALALLRLLVNVSSIII